MLEGFHKRDEWTETITASLVSIWREPFSLRKSPSSFQSLCPVLHTAPATRAAPHVFQCPSMPWVPLYPCEGERTASPQLYGEGNWFQRDSVLSGDSILISWGHRGPRSPDLLCSYCSSSCRTLGTVRKQLSTFYSRVVWAHWTSSETHEPGTCRRTWPLCCFLIKSTPWEAKAES